MNVQLIATDEMKKVYIQKLLEDHGFEVDGPGDSERCGIVFLGPKSNRSALLERMEEMQCKHLVVCTSTPSPQIQRKFPAAQMVCPEEWTEQILGKRILGELFTLVEEPEPYVLRGRSKKIQKVLADTQKMARGFDPVLITGLAGTGKELVARMIHQFSHRKGPFIPVNCAEFTSDMINSELFGHKRGAFTGSVGSRQGLLKSGEKGTVFLDEIGELGQAEQAKLLRLIEYGEMRSVGSDEVEEVDTRLILATNRDLIKAQKEGLFREDLYERISFLSIELPELKERMEDIPLLVHHFIKEWNDGNRDLQVMDPSSMDPFFEYSWPGNVRELRGVIRRVARFSEHGERLNRSELFKVIKNRSKRKSFRETTHSHQISFTPGTETWEEFEARVWLIYAKSLLDFTGQSKPKAAELAKMSRSRFYERIKDIGTT